MKVVCCVVLCFVAMATAHYPGYPFAHVNGGRYGVAFPYANHIHGYQGSAPVEGQGRGFSHNNEFVYRGFGGTYPVHVGSGNFIYLGKFNGECAQAHNYGFYFAGKPDSFVVCDNGRAHTFQCPAGTLNHEASHYQVNGAYAMHELCGVNINN